MKKNLSFIICDLLRYAVASIFMVTVTLADQAANPSSSNAWESASVEELTEIISQTAVQISEHARKAS